MMEKIRQSRLLMGCLVAGSLISLFGCGGSSGTPASSTVPPSVTTTATIAAAAPAPIEFLPISAGGFHDALTEQKGKVVLIDFWFLACSPCRKKFPHLVEIHRKYAADGLMVFTYSIDPNDAKNVEKVKEFLEKVAARGMTHFVAAEQADADTVMSKFGVEYTPMMVLIGRDGKRIEVPENATDEQVELLIREALKSA
jgi:thiol-disulfide isomerase/thioredoxin